MRRAKRSPAASGIAAVLLLATLAGCGEKAQVIDASAAKPDGQGWQGAQNAFVAPGYQPGDKTRWQTQLRQRAQTQNEYLKTQ